jgi:hypothetical protein
MLAFEPLGFILSIEAPPEAGNATIASGVVDTETHAAIVGAIVSANSYQTITRKMFSENGIARILNYEMNSRNCNE